MRPQAISRATGSGLWLRPKRFWPALATLALSGSLGCEPEEEGMSLELLSQPPAQASVEVAYPRVRLPAGVALLVGFPPQATGAEPANGPEALELLSDQPDTAQALRTQWPRRFLIVGHRPGDAILRVLRDGEQLGRVRVEVAEHKSGKQKSQRRPSR